jgi:hypothetical protein
MRRALIMGAATLVATLAPVTSAVAARPAGPTQAQIEKALAAAQSSPQLWATVNVCVPDPEQGGLIGIRGEMPALGFPATLSMTVALNQFVSRTRGYQPVAGDTATRTVTIGTFAGHVHQGGAEFPFSADTPRLNATVTFTWSRAGRTLGQITRTTEGGHPQADFGRPPHHSSATCKF